MDAVIAADRGSRALAGGDPVRVAIVGATGYVGAELIRLLALHPHAVITGLVGRERKGDPIAGIHPHLATRNLHVYDHVPGRRGGGLPRPPARRRRRPDRRVPGPRPDRHRPGPRLPVPGRRGLPDLVPRGAPAPGAARGRRLRPAGAAPRGAGGAGGRSRRHRRLAGLLRHDHDPRPGAPRPRRPHRGPRRGREERRLGRRPGPEGGPPLRRGQRERQGVRHLHAPPHRRDRAGAGRASPPPRTPTRARGASTSCRTSCR